MIREMTPLAFGSGIEFLLRTVAFFNGLTKPASSFINRSSSWAWIHSSSFRGIWTSCWTRIPRCGPVCQFLLLSSDLEHCGKGTVGTYLVRVSGI
jgi:hypothetical protein